MSRFSTVSFWQDHINFIVGKQAYLIGDLGNSVTALRRNLTQFSRQPPERQSLFIREYLVVLKVIDVALIACHPVSLFYFSYCGGSCLLRMIMTSMFPPSPLSYMIYAWVQCKRSSSAALAHYVRGDWERPIITLEFERAWNHTISL